MSFLVRKIARGKWPDNDYPLVNIPEDIPAKFSLDLRSNDDNSLSFWYIDSENEDDLKEAVLALATGPQVDSVDNIDIVWLDREQLEKKLIWLCKVNMKKRATTTRNAIKIKKLT